MSKHLRAEWFRVTHIGVYLYLYIIFGLLAVGMPLLINTELSHADLFTCMAGSSESMSLTFPMFIGTLTAVMIGLSYYHRVYYYEIMDGASIHKMIASRLLIYNGMAFVCFVLPLGIVCMFFLAKNGAGQIENVPLLACLALLVVIHMVNRAVLFAMLIKNLVGGAFVPYLTVMLEQMSYAVFSSTNPGRNEQLQKVFDWLISIQFMRLAQPEYEAGFVIAVLGSLAVESVVLYIAVYVTYKRKLFK